ncbi:DNA-binding protein [Methylobacterium sp. AMS5]|nr:DNA-binding protein [Methylobacterium sp. AMS5]
MTVVSRDRSGPYAEAARTGAPTATQVADRWHLLVNASEALRGIVERHQSEIRDVAHRLVHASSDGPHTTESAPTSEVHNQRRDRCETALRFHGEGMPTKEIARRIGASRNTVRRWVRAGRFRP